MGERMITLANGHRIWTNAILGGPGLPLLILHGGPGTGHDYLESYETLSRDRPVVFYDQLGCGRSDHPQNLSLWTIERFADEVDEVRAALGLHQCHILGQSWGGFIAIEFLLRQPPGIRSAILASTTASMPQYMIEVPKMIATLSDEDQAALALHLPTGAFDHPDFQTATQNFYRKFLCRLDPWPDCIMRTIANTMRSPSGLPLMGPTELNVLGNMRYWNRVADLGRIAVPTLVTCGRHDQIGPVHAQTLVAGIAQARLVIFEYSTHSSHLEEPEVNFAEVGAFLAEHDQSA